LAEFYHQPRAGAPVYFTESSVYYPSNGCCHKCHHI